MEGEDADYAIAGAGFRWQSPNRADGAPQLGSETLAGLLRGIGGRRSTAAWWRRHGLGQPLSEANEEPRATGHRTAYLLAFRIVSRLTPVSS